jgi:hypothetical protein
MPFVAVVIRMLRQWLTRALARVRSGDEDADADDEDERRFFVPSRLDASVLYAHGMGTGQAERELANIEKKAEILEEEHHRER